MTLPYSGRRQVVLAFGSAMVALVVVGAAAHHGMTVSSESGAAVRHSRDLLESLQELLVTAERLQADAHAFILTGQPASLDAYREGVLQAPGRVAAVRTLTADNPDQSRRFVQLNEVIARQVERTGRLVALRSSAGLPAAAAGAGDDERLMRDIRRLVAELQSDERHLLARRTTEAGLRVTQTTTVLILGTILGLLVAALAGWSVQRDSVRRTRIELALRDGQEKYRGLLEAAPDAMVVVNPVGAIVLLNLQAEKQFGYQRDELVGQNVTSIIPAGFAERLLADGLRSPEDALTQHIGTGIELTALRKDHSEFPIEIMLSPCETAGVVLVTAAIRDITVRRATDAKLLEKVSELSRSNEELRQFAYVASHDLQEPLRMVASFTQLLSTRYTGRLDADADEFIAFAVDGATRMQHLIQDLLVLSRVGTQGKELRDTSSEEALLQALQNLQGATADSGGEVTHDPLPVVAADGAQLIQLFQNLIGNAMKYHGPDKPRVHVSVHKDDEQKWVFSVQDNGMGIDPQYFDRIFGMFQRLHVHDEFAGTGIGLAICKKIVERHGGRMSVTSALGQGATFSFGLPEASDAS